MSALTDTADPDATSDTPAPAGLTEAVRWKVPVLTPPPAAAPPRNPSLPTFVGLIILILTFFIVLTSISIKDSTKTDAAMSSVQQAFSGNAITDEARDEDDTETARAYIAGLTARIQSLVPLMGGKPGPAADHQVLWLPTELAFAADGARLEPVFPKILGEVVRSLPSIPQRFTPHVEMRLCATDASEMVRQRAMAIGAALSAQQAPLNQFSVGIARCDPARIGIAIALAPAAAEGNP